MKNNLRESTTTSFVRLDAAQQGDVLWRNNVGVLKDLTGRPVRYGLANDTPAMNKVIKSSDLIGIHPLLITPQMVGMIIGQFLAIEMKEEGWVFNHLEEREVAQKNFHDIVRKNGGRAGFATGVADYRRIIGND